ncbi:hypothetical protein F5Y00DRAFT_257380 [Daldinia vernicosa]|uniref:uncharacterized protein n=1 Tax=Daldinia vernicosa TaxID=114800 RepID=UPI0020074795|nr:uncharacterized protein F5Y00DRAFT_257380 [Daldinia vernicosa]KAI0853355.1 hypothetical protein F5Y00DRAFT_257380 [Daldinia vernicosa]
MDGNTRGQGLDESIIVWHESDTDIDMCYADELDIDINEDKSDYEGEDEPGELFPINTIMLGTESATYHWHYPIDHMSWVKRVWSALDPELPGIAKDAAAMILLADRKERYTLSPVFKFLNQQAKLRMQGKAAARIPRLYLAILQAMALCDDKAASGIYELVPSLKPMEHSSGSNQDSSDHRGTWHWGSDTSIVEIFTTHPPKGHTNPYAILGLTDDFKWPVGWDMDWSSESSKGERICFDKISPHWEAHLMENSRESNPEWYKACVVSGEVGDLRGLAMMPRGMSDAIDVEGCMHTTQSAVKYQTLTEQLKLMINNGNISGDAVDNLLKQIEGHSI